MEHSLPALELARPWRRATLVASTVAALELVLIVVLALTLVGRPVAEKLEEKAAAPAAPAAQPKPAAKPKTGQAAPLPRSQTAVLVLNGNGRGGAAGRAGEQIKSTGYIVAGVGNAPRTDYKRTFVMYQTGRKSEAQRLARDLGTGVVAPLDGIEKSALMGAHVAVILGP